MTVEEVKKFVKEKYNRDLTDEEAQAVLNSNGGELSEKDLSEVAGGEMCQKHYAHGGDAPFEYYIPINKKR